MTDNARRTDPALEAHQQFLLWLVPTVEKFPVTGEAEGGRIILHGQAPNRGPKCKVPGYRSEALIFDAKGKI